MFAQGFTWGARQSFRGTPTEFLPINRGRFHIAQIQNIQILNAIDGFFGLPPQIVLRIHKEHVGKRLFLSIDRELAAGIMGEIGNGILVNPALCIVKLALNGPVVAINRAGYQVKAQIVGIPVLRAVWPVLVLPDRIQFIRIYRVGFQVGHHESLEQHPLVMYVFGEAV